MELMVRKRQNIMRILLVLILLSEVLSFLIDYVRKTNVFEILNVVYLGCLLGSIIVIFVKEESYYRKIMIRKLALPLFFSASIAIPYIIKTIYFPNSKLELNELIQVYVSYLSFSSALVLGYVVYINNLKKEEKTLQKNAKILLDNLQYEIDLWLIAIKRGNYLHKFDDIIEWKKYYYEIYPAIGRYEDVIRFELDKFYKLVECLNYQIESGNIENIKSIYQKHIDDEYKNIHEYNSSDMISVILSIANPELGKVKPWYTSKAVRHEISKMKKQYEKRMYQWIASFLSINKMAECDRQVIDTLLYEWLLKQADINEWIKFPTDKRKVMKLVSEVILSINSNSDSLELCWGVISLK